MAWFRRKGKFRKYWYFVERINGKEVQHYIGDDQAVLRKLLPKKDVMAIKKNETTKKISRR